jgi:hypothetical protein
MSQVNGSLTRDFFRQKAQPVTATVGGVPLIAEPKEFSTGSLGWYCGGKLTLNVDGQQVRVQVGVTLTVIGSKEIPR